MACQPVYTWSFSDLVAAFLDLYISFFLLCASAAAFWASKFLGVLGLSLPCPCDGVFGIHFTKNLCFKKLFIEYPIEKISNVELSVRSRFPFNDIVWIRHPNCDLNLRLIRDEEREVIELDGYGGSSSCSKVSITRKSSNNFSFNGDLDAKNEVSKGVVKELGTKEGRFGMKGKGIMHHRQPSSGFRRRRKSSFDQGKHSSFSSYDSVFGSSVQDYPKFTCSFDGERDNFAGFGQRVSSSIGLTEVPNNDHQCTDNDITSARVLTDNGDKNTIKLLEKALEEQHASYSVLYLELEKERSASASSAEEAMAMIQRLQEEKASIEIEARQYQRILEEKSAYDAEEMRILEEILIHRERENHYLEEEVESYREIMSASIEQSGPQLPEFSFYSNDDVVPMQSLREEPHSVIDLSLSEEPYSHDVHVTTQQSKSVTSNSEVHVGTNVSSMASINLDVSSGFPLGNLNGRSLKRDSLSIIDDERQRIDNEIGWLREKLKIVKEGKEKLYLSAELGETGWRKLNLLEDIAHELQEIKQLTEHGKTSRQASLPLPYSKVISKKRRCRCVSSGQHMSS